MKDHHKYPRLYSELSLKEGAHLLLEDAQHHYLANVLRKKTGDKIRLFNPENGEFIAEVIEVKKKNLSVSLLNQIRQAPSQNQDRPKLHMHFAPIHKQRMDMIIEKSVELGVDHVQPIVTEFTQNRSLKEERIQAQIIEASEQCERLDIPSLGKAQKLSEFINSFEKETPQDAALFIALERCENTPYLPLALKQVEAQSIHILIGPEGGFSDQERQMILESSKRCKAIQPVHLGDLILRAETAAITSLAYIGASVRAE